MEKTDITLKSAEEIVRTAREYLDKEKKIQQIFEKSQNLNELYFDTEDTKIKSQAETQEKRGNYILNEQKKLVKITAAAYKIEYNQVIDLINIVSLISSNMKAAEEVKDFYNKFIIK